MKIIYLTLCLLLMASVSWAQEWTEIKGKVMRATDKTPIESARVWSADAKKSVVTDQKGEFIIQVNKKHTTLLFESYLYLSKEVPVNGREQLEVYLLDVNTPAFHPEHTLPLGQVNHYDRTGNPFSRGLKDLNNAKPFLDETLYGTIPGLQALEKSGMPGEGAYLNLRSIRSLSANNAPLIVVDGLPLLPDMEESPVISGYSKNILMPVSLKDVRSFTFVQGADAAMYGSMGSNGVLLIETDKASDMETKVEFQTINGLTWMNKRYPMLDADGFKSYLVDVGETKVANTNELVALFPFLKDDYDYQHYYRHIYGNNTDWQDEIYNQCAFSTENILKVKGGDEIAKYNLTAGYLRNNGVVKNTDLSKYYTRLNADLNVSAKVKMSASFGFSYVQSHLQEQGMVPQTNPLLAALYKAPVLGVWEKDMYGNRVSRFDTVRQFGISNPRAVVEQVEATMKTYDILGNIALNYQPNTKFNFDAMLGIYYNYNSENLFVPGKSQPSIAPLMDGYAHNTVRGGVGLGYNIYAKAQGSYKHTFKERHNVTASLGYQLITSRREYDHAEVVNTTSDFYKTLDRSESDYGKKIDGYEDIWNWMNAYARLYYNYNHLFYLSATLAADAASSTGKNAVRLQWLPGVNLGINLKNTVFLQDVNGIDEFLVRGAWAVLGNSRYSSVYSQNYYVNQPFHDIVGMVKENIPNSRLKPEKVESYNAGIDFSLLGRRLALSLNYYRENTRDMLLGKEMPSAYGYGRMFTNAGKLKTDAVEASLHLNLLQRGQFQWYAGGNITHYKTKVSSLGGEKSMITDFSDGSQLITQVGESPFAFYGFEAGEVFSTQEDADAAGLVSYNGNSFQAGDIHFADRNGDHVIDDADRTILGSATPDFFGGFYTGFRYRGLELSALFSYSYGNEIYNVTRRNLESLDGFINQTETAARRWNNYGQITDMPRANYGDPAGNNRFSSRWIEDGSYLKLKNVTLSYTFPRELSFIRQLQIYLSGDNLLTFTKYLGLDPEFSWSYSSQLQGIDQGKIPTASSVRLGVKLNF